MTRRKERIISSLDELGKDIRTEEVDSLTIKFQGEAYKKLHEISKKLQDANGPDDVVSIALALLLKTEGKKVKLERDDGETVIAEIWK